ncbi:MAG: single-stranded-DNA-specific exonuclease RecJ [Holosporales bacterium]
MHPSNLSVSGRMWRLVEPDLRLTLALSQRFGVPEVVGRLLANRGLTLDTAEAFLNPALRTSLPNPFHLKDMDVAVSRILDAIQKGEAICIFGDYDVDGATSSALLVRYLKTLGAKVNFYIPDRLKEGYGPNGPALQQLAAQGVRLVICVDSGTTAFEALDVAAAIGLDVIVVDHHVAEPKLPSCVALINPNRLDQESPCQHLAAVGICFLLAVALRGAARAAGVGDPHFDLFSLLDLVALGTVCDVMPLTGLNRAFVSQGLKVLAKRQNVGLRALSDVASIDEAPTAYHLGFLLGPRINAGGRIGCARLGAELLTTEDPHLARSIAERLNALNSERQAMELQVVEEAMQQAEQSSAEAVVVAGQGWHPGVIGVVAGRLKEQLHRPVIVIGLDEQGMGKGSGRSVPGVDLGALIIAARQQGLLLAGGGHPMAGGLTIAAEQIKPFRLYVQERIAAQNMDLTPVYKVDGLLSGRAAGRDLCLSLQKLAPFGQGNPSPRFAISDVRVSRATIVGNGHVKATLSHADGTYLDGIAFRAADTPLGETLLAPTLNRNLTLAGSIKLDTWGGKERVQLLIDDVHLNFSSVMSYVA